MLYDFVEHEGQNLISIVWTMVRRFVRCWVGALGISVARWNRSSPWPSSKSIPCSGSMIMVPEGMGRQAGSRRFSIDRSTCHRLNKISSAVNLTEVSFRITGPSAVDDLLLGADRGGTVITLDIQERREFSSCSIRFLYTDLTFLIASLISSHS